MLPMRQACRVAILGGVRNMKLALAGHGLHLLQVRPVRRSLMPRLWLPKPWTQPPVCSPSFRTCRRMWSDGRASWGACEARTWARWNVMQAVQVSRRPLSSRGARLWETRLSAHLSCSVHPGEDTATAIGQTEPSGEPWSA